MARRTLSRMELRRASEAADALAQSEGNGDKAVAPKKAAKATKPRARKSAKAKAPVRMRVRWAVVNDSLKQVAIFDYPQKTEADEKAADLIGKGKGNHFVRLVKEPMPEVAEVV